MNLKDLRKERGLIAQYLSRQLGITYRQYHNIETGLSGIDEEKAKKLAAIYGLGTKEILKAWRDGTNEKTRTNAIGICSNRETGQA